ncbi:MAG: EF-hand domain-containing protein [Proteobacteria bacterium]|nr:EF-hand domain-containing protein [Pseudomonadota bacterium]
MKKQMLLVLVLASAGLSASAFAQSTTPASPAASSTRPMHGMRLDSNGDGMISRDEAASAPRLADKFDQIDTNKDGKLSSDEMKAWREQHGRRGAAGGDMAGGAMGDRHGACFDKADTDKNGQLSRAEFANLRQACGGMMHHGGRGAAAGTPASPAPAASASGSQAKPN